MKLKLTIMFLCCFHFGYSQLYSGKVIDNESKAPIQFVTIGIINKNKGTLSDETGKFKINLESQYYKDSIRLSIIGYESKSFLVKDFRDFLQDSGKIVKLNKKIYSLTEVVIRPNEFGSKIIGKKIMFPPGFLTQMYDSSGSIAGCEYGALLKIPKPVCFVDDIRLSVESCTFDSIILRLNIYKIDKKKNIECILREPIYVTINNFEGREEKIFDLRKYNLKVNTNFIAAFEVVKPYGCGYISFFNSLWGDPLYYRLNGQSEWSRHRAKLSICSKVTYAK